MANWGGGGGFEGDEYTADVSATYGAKNLTAIGSPRVNYRTVSGASAATLSSWYIRYDAGWDNSANRFAHNAFAAFGCSQKNLHIKYSTASDFSSVTALHTLTLDRWTGKNTAAAVGNVVALDWDAPKPLLQSDVWSGQGELGQPDY